MDEEDDLWMLNLDNQSFVLEVNGSNLTEFSLHMDVGLRIFWDSLFGSSMFISIVGNLAVMWIILGEIIFPNFPGRILSNFSE